MWGSQIEIPVFSELLFPVLVGQLQAIFLGIVLYLVDLYKKYLY